MHVFVSILASFSLPMLITGSLVWPVLASLASIVVALLLCKLLPRPLLLLRRRWCPSGGRGVERFNMLLLAALSVLCALCSALVGSSDLLGCFCAGLVVSQLDVKVTSTSSAPDGAGRGGVAEDGPTDAAEDAEDGKAGACQGGAPTIHASFVRHFGSLCRWGTALFFAATIGFGVPSFFAAGGGLFAPEALTKGACMAVAAIVGKFLCALAVFPFSASNVWRFGWAMNGRGEFSFLIAAVALEDGVLGSADFAAAVWGAFIASLVAPFAFRGCCGCRRRCRKQARETETEGETTGRGVASESGVELPLVASM